MHLEEPGTHSGGELRQEVALVATRLEESPDGPARKYYKLTRAGNKERLRMNTYYEGLSEAVDTLVTPA